MGEQRDSGARVMVCSTACVNKSVPDTNSVLKNFLLCLIIRPQISIRKMCLECSTVDIQRVHPNAGLSAGGLKWKKCLNVLKWDSITY